MKIEIEIHIIKIIVINIMDNFSVKSHNLDDKNNKFNIYI